jgi:uncharacterized protein YfiM (DUF2279 family)
LLYKISMIWLILILVAFKPLSARIDFKIIEEQKNSINLQQETEKSSVCDPWFSPDKGSHFIGSLICTIGFTKSMQEFHKVRKDNSVYLGTGITFSLGLGKEIRDSFQPGNIFSCKDLAANCLGICLGILLLRVP